MPSTRALGIQNTESLYRTPRFLRGTDHDLFFVPKSSSETNEIAKEEASLLALLHMTPSFPHKRKLPEPYKTTWLCAVEAVKQLKQTKNAAQTNSILIIGASGGTGRVAVSVTKALGIDNIVGVCSTRNMDFCKEQGATHILDFTKGKMQDLVEDYCQQHGNFDVIFDCVTSADPRDSQYNYPAKLKPYCEE